MDLTLNVEDYKLNIRAACIIEHNGKVLLHRNIKSDHYALLGGRIAIGESSEETIKREILEELEKEIVITGYVATIENFFEMNGSKYHEYMFVYKAEFKDEKDKLIQETLENKEEKEYLRYEWIDVEKIDDFPLKPQIAKDILKERIFPVHMINRDS